MTWELQEAKLRFSEVVRRALTEGPQWVTRNGRRVVVVVAAEDFESTENGQSFKDFLLSGPELQPLDIRRSGAAAPDVSL